MNVLRRLVAGRLWRRLVFSHLAVILLAVLILQVCLAALGALITSRIQPTEGDAGLLAHALAQTAGRLMETGRTEDIPLALEMMKQGVVALPDPYGGADDPYTVTSSTPADWLERLTAVTVLDEYNDVVITMGTGVAQREHPAVWEELVSSVQSGEKSPYELSRRLTPGDGGLLLGAAAITRSGGENAGVVVVEMHSTPQWETASAPVASLLGFLFVMATTSVLFGLPVLVIAALVSAFSGIVVSRSLSERLRRLENTARKMAGGDLTLRIADTSPDEIGQVGRAFNRMAERLAQSLEALETLLRARRDLVANVSHDLRTPVASLSAHLETLSEHPERLDEYLPILGDETARISGLIDDLFELSRLDAHELKLDTVPVALDGVIGKVVAGYKTLAWDQRRIVLETNLPDRLPPVLADVQRVEQVLANLITNGLRFTPEGGVITLGAEALAGEVEVRVSDTGIGIPPGDLPHIFERFYRGDRSRARPEPDDRLGSGSGLGLAIVKGLVEAMGGSVSATSAPGEGTCISFRLPVAEG